ncbi:AIPR family protein [Methylobacterium currus]|nr:AIPR family protein [Methylobacterium currus]
MFRDTVRQQRRGGGDPCQSEANYVGFQVWIAGLIVARINFIIDRINFFRDQKSIPSDGNLKERNRHMAVIQHRQICDNIKSIYIPNIDVSDIKSVGEDLEINKLSRGVAAYAIAYLTGADPVTAGSSITDGFGDNGVDAIYYDKNEQILYVVQSKWNTKHAGSVELGDILKFIKGCKDLLSSRFIEFNDKVKKRSKEIDIAINQASKVVAVVVYSGSANFSEESRSAIDSFIDEVDETRELLSSQVINQSQLYSMLQQGAAGASISSPITLFEWGEVREPVKAFYGQIAASDLADLHGKFGHRLFSRNIRMFLGDSTQVNNGIQETVATNPELFWFYNNGITALASTVKRRLAGGGSRTAGTFDCDGLTIVNGAQTIGSLAAANQKMAGQLQNARVPFRVVSTEGAPEGFVPAVTRTNNTQNRIDARNFVALDQNQERLRSEFAIDKVDYEFRQGEIENSGPSRLGLVEATLALACTRHEVDLAVQAKREIGKLWEDIGRPPYKTLFNSRTTSEEIWSKVLAFRRIDKQITTQEIARSGKSANIITHGNRFIAHGAYKRLQEISGKPSLENLRDDEVEKTVKQVIEFLISCIEAKFPDNYVASLFKNVTKCRALSRDIEAQFAM